MRQPLALVAIAALAAAWCVPAASEAPTLPVAGQVLCENGHVVAIRAIVPMPGVVTLRWGADACTAKPEAPPASAPQPAASGSRVTI